MKRFLSILLSAILILGTVSVTVFAAPELTLVTTNTLSGMSSNTFADKDKYVLFNAIEGATYKNNGVAATVITNPLNKADFVALKVDNTGVNMFTAEVDGVTSNAVGVYGVATTAGTATNSGRGTTDVDVEAITDETLKAALSERENVVYYSGTSGSSIKTVAVDDTATYRIKNSVYINQDTINGYVGLLRTNKYAAIRADLSIYLEGSGSNSGGQDTGFDAVTHAWNDFEYVHYKYTVDGAIVGKADVYFNDILIGKNLGNYASSWTLYSTMVNATDRSGNVYHTRVEYSPDTISYNPTLTAVADDDNDTITVTGTDVDEFANYTAKVFVNGVATVDEVTVNAADAAEPVATTISVPSSVENATVYVAYVDDEGDMLSALSLLKSNELTYTSIAASDVVVPLNFSLNTSAARNISGTLSAEAGKKVLFNVVELESHQSGTVKYYHNGAEVTDVTSPVTGTVALPVVKGENTYFVARVDDTGAIMVGSESPKVYVNGLDMNATKYRGYYANNSDRFTSQITEEAPTVYDRDNVVKIGVHSWLTGKPAYDEAANAFTAEGGANEYVKYTLDAYYNLVDGAINGTAGAYAIMAAGTINGSAAYKHYVRIADDGNVTLGTATDYADSEMKVAPGEWHTFELCLNKNSNFDLYIDGYLVIINYCRSGSAFSAHDSGVYWYTGDPASADNDVYLSGDYKYYYIYDYDITGSLSTGSVSIPAEAVKDLVTSGEKITILGIKDNGNIDTTSVTFDGNDASASLTAAPYSKMFVWVLNKLLPLGVISE